MGRTKKPPKDSMTFRFDPKVCARIRRYAVDNDLTQSEVMERGFKKLIRDGSQPVSRDDLNSALSAFSAQMTHQFENLGGSFGEAVRSLPAASESVSESIERKGFFSRLLDRLSI